MKNMGPLVQTTVAITLIFVGIYIGIAKIQSYRRIEHIKGPRGAGWSKYWLASHQFGGRLPWDLVDIARQYGPIARLAPNWVVVSDISEIRRIWSVRSGYYRSTYYNGYRFDPNRDTLLTINDNKEHHHLRAKVIPGYSGKGLTNQEALIDAATAKLIELIDCKYLTTRAGGERPLDGSHVFTYFAQDANSAVEFGKPFGYLDKNSDYNGIIDALESMIPVTSVMALFPPVLWLVKSPMMRPFLPKPTDEAGVGRLLGIVQGLVKERYDEHSNPNTKSESRSRDVLQVFTESSLSPVEVEAEALLHLVGGTDTTATALRTTLFYLASKPSAYRALQNEIDDFVRDGKASRPIISDAESKTLPYLQAVIKEGLRIWPPIMGLMAKMSPQDDVICGQKVPAGTHVAFGWLTAMRNRELFGEDADVFEPGRWVEAWKAARAEVETDEVEGKATARVKEMEAVQGMAFAAGSRWECLGKRLAYMEMGKVLFELFLRYDFAMADPSHPFDWMNYGFTLHDKMNFLVTKREPSIV